MLWFNFLSGLEIIRFGSEYFCQLIIDLVKKKVQNLIQIDFYVLSSLKICENTRKKKITTNGFLFFWKYFEMSVLKGSVWADYFIYLAQKYTINKPISISNPLI